MTTENPDDLLTVAELAAHLRVSTATVRKWIAREWIPNLKVGKIIRINRPDALAALSALAAGNQRDTGIPDDPVNA